MPIKKENRHLYAKDWTAISLAVRNRAGWVCERIGCGAVNGRPHPITGSKVVLTVAHLDHDPRNNADSNLSALCQRCHLDWDRAHHQKNAAQTRRRAMATMEMFDE